MSRTAVVAASALALVGLFYTQVGLLGPAGLVVVLVLIAAMAASMVPEVDALSWLRPLAGAFLLGSTTAVLVLCALGAALALRPEQPRGPIGWLIYAAAYGLALLAASHDLLRRGAPGHARHASPPSPGTATLAPIAQPTSEVSLGSAGRVLVRQGAVALTGALAALAVVPLLPIPRTLADITGNTLGSSRSTASGAESAGTSADYSGGSDVDLNRRFGQLSSQPLAWVPLQAPRYWRSSVTNVYDGRRLLLADARARSIAAPSLTSGALFTADVSTWRLEAEPTPPAAQGRGPQHQVMLNGRLQRGRVGVLAPGSPQSLTLRFGTSLDFAGGGTITIYPAGDYEVSALQTPSVSDLPADGGTLEAGAVADWTALPPGVSARTVALARQITAAATTPRAKVLAIESYLRSAYTYDLRAEVPPAGTDVVDHFLFTSRRGFCVHFATAELVLLRSLGIPARVVTGYVSGDPDPRRAGWRVISPDRAHAWVEVNFAESGWATSDPTPAQVSSSQHWFSALRVDPIVLLLLILTALGWLGSWWWRRVRRVSRVRRVRREDRQGPSRAEAMPVPHASARYPELEAAYQGLVSALGHSPQPPPPGATPAELARRVPTARDALELVERAHYDYRELASRECLDAIAALEAAVVGSHESAPRTG